MVSKRAVLPEPAELTRFKTSRPFFKKTSRFSAATWLFAVWADALTSIFSLIIHLDAFHQAVLAGDDFSVKTPAGGTAFRHFGGHVFFPAGANEGRGDEFRVKQDALVPLFLQHQLQ